MAAQPQYGIGAEVRVSYEEAANLVREALSEQGFGIMTEIDVKETMKKKLDVDFRPYVILGACNPQLAHKALTEELDIGLLLPCNVVVYSTGDDSAVVEAISPLEAMSVVENAALQEVADEAESRLGAAVRAVVEQAGAA